MNEINALGREYEDLVRAGDLDAARETLATRDGVLLTQLKAPITKIEAIALLHAIDIANPQWRMRYDTPELRAKLHALANP